MIKEGHSIDWENSRAISFTKPLVPRLVKESIKSLIIKEGHSTIETAFPHLKLGPLYLSVAGPPHTMPCNTAGKGAGHK